MTAAPEVSTTFTHACHVCGNEVRVENGLSHPHECALATRQVWYDAQPINVPVITHAWLGYICRQLMLDPEDVREIRLNGRLVTAALYLRGEDGEVQVNSTGDGVITTERVFVVGEAPTQPVSEGDE